MIDAEAAAATSESAKCGKCDVFALSADIRSTPAGHHCCPVEGAVTHLHAAVTTPRNSVHPRMCGPGQKNKKETRRALSYLPKQEH